MIIFGTMTSGNSVDPAMVTAIAGTITSLGGVIGVILLHLRESRKNAKRLNQASTSIKNHMEAVAVKMNGAPIAFLERLPYPAWIKEVSGRILYINAAYTAWFGIRPDQYVKRFDSDVWPDSVAKAFAEHDQRIIESRRSFEVVELFPRNPFDPKSEVLRHWVSKFPILSEPGGEVTKIGGMIIPPPTVSSIAEAFRNDPNVYTTDRDKAIGI